MLQKSFISLRHRALWGYVAVSLVLVLIMAAGLLYGVYTLGALTRIFSLGWLDATLDWIFVGGAGVLTWFLIPALMPLISSIFADNVSRIIHTRDYGDTSWHDASVIREIGEAAKFSLMVIGVNLLLLPVYLITGPFIYYPVNAWLLGREYFEAEAIRHVPRSEVSTLRSRHNGARLMAGAVLLLVTIVPPLMLVAPIIATVYMAHFWQRYYATKP